MASYFVSNQTQLNSAMRAVTGGDSIVLASSFKNAGIYISGFNKPGGLTITSEAGGMASATMLKIFASSGIKVQNLDIPQSANTSLTVAIKDSSNIAFSGLYIHGTSDLNKAGEGMTVRGSTSVSITNSRFEKLAGGLTFIGNDGLTVKGNSFSQIVTDGLLGSSTSNLLVQDNYFTDFRHFGSSHPDAIQLYTRAGDPVVHDITITGNVYNRGSGTAVQGIWINDDANIGGYENVTVTGNAILGGLYNGIGLIGVTSGVVSGNLVQGYADLQSWIRVAGTRGNVTVDQNVATSYVTGDAKVSFAGNSATLPIAGASLQALGDAIASYAGSGIPGLSAFTQSYLKSVSGSMRVADMLGSSAAYGLPVAGTVSDLLANPGHVRAFGGQITGDNTVSITQYNALTALGKLARASDATLSVQGTTGELLAGSNSWKLSSSTLVSDVTLIGQNIVSANQAATLVALPGAHLGAGASLVIMDWTSNFAKVLPSLQSAADKGLISSITLTDRSPVLNLTDSQYTGFARALDLITNSTRELVKVAAGNSVTARDAGAQLDGSAGHAVLVASNDGNTLIGGDGDILVGGPGKDTFVLRGHFGGETVRGFDSKDLFQLDRALVSDYRHLAHMMHQDGSDVVIDLGAGDILTLTDTSLANLGSANFVFM